jgi:ADP-ribosylglycohydrolase
LLLPPDALGLVPDPEVDLRSRYRGALLAGAVGDALGRPVEGRAREHVTGPITEFTKWHGWCSGPIGTITDDTQLTMLVAQCLVDGKGVIDPEAMAAQLVKWLPKARGIGAATRSAVEQLREGVEWYTAGEPSAGNGAAMRSAPLGLALRRYPDRMRQQAAVSAVITHAHQMAVVSSAVMAFATAWCACRAPGTNATELLDQLDRVAGDLHDEGALERRADRDLGPVRLIDRIREVGDVLDLEPDAAFDHFYNGAFVLESLPAALWCFLRSPTETERVLVTAASGGRDADTVAAMAGNLAGAFNGEDSIPRRWLAELEYHDELRRLADALLELSGPAHRTDP